MNHTDKKVNPITIRSKKWIVDSLIELMEEKPYKDISIKEIADRAGLVRQTVYRNFKTKDAIVKHYVDNFYIFFYNMISEKESISFYDLLLLYFEYWDQNRNFIKKLIDNDIYILLLDMHLDYIKNMAGDAKFEKLIFRIRSKHERYMNHFSAGGLWFVLKKWIEDDNPAKPAEMANIILNFYNIKRLNTKYISFLENRS
ncbi:TetR/AcrR family transcriptional regulator [Clostridium sp. 'deep sea']|uniref:TetR/AcrR family transcriptional regulator n=1 Tax=Clostridium sp. 'deep sea' TaxID=2779445 RepID=UPI0018966F55|nr:TetR/AcrR family transcriptional regulator [Clostridium sp. 'deep sea']QOR36778.1 TetR/AcrR family transcriptional regulator [Clostridium sp. 'deep sea']